MYEYIFIFVGDNFFMYIYNIIYIMHKKDYIHLKYKMILLFSIL